MGRFSKVFPGERNTRARTREEIDSPLTGKRARDLLEIVVPNLSKVDDDNYCQFCLEQKDIAEHIICRCGILNRQRPQHLGFKN